MENLTKQAHSFCETPKEKCTMNYCDENGCQNRKRELVEPKQETIEEAAENYLNSGKIPNDYRSFIEGAKWQQERMYSEEEVLDIIKSRENYLDNTPKNSLYINVKRMV